MWTDLPLSGLILVLAGFGWRLLRRPESGVVTCWVLGWMSAGSAGVLAFLGHTLPVAHLLTFPLGSLFPALLLSGALMLAGRTPPGWLLPVAVGWGALRAALAAAGKPSLAYAVALPVEPVVVLGAAWIVFRATPRGADRRSERLLAPSLVVLAALGAIHVAWMTVTPSPPSGLFAMWLIGVPLLVGVQIQAYGSRGHRALERRVEERTAELARANALLRGEIAERRAVDQALRESEERYRVVSELSSDLSFGFHVDGQERVSSGWGTEAFARITGFTLDEMDGKGWLGALHPEDVERARQHFDAIVAGRVRELDLRMVAKDGRIVAFHVNLEATREADGSVRVVGAARDVTEAIRFAEERRRLDLALQETQRLESLAMLTGGVAHDFNNLLTVILGQSRIALADLAPESTLHGRLERIRTAADHGARLTEQMLAYAGKASVARKPLDLSSEIEELDGLLRASVSERCHLSFRLTPGATVEADATQLRQVVLNLVTNASEGLVDGAGTVSVRTGLASCSADDLVGAVGSGDVRPGTYAFLEVADDGRGMDAATRDRMFEPFFTTRFSGRGLGLAAVLGIVRAHGGVLCVHSAPGQGTVIRVLFPRGPAAAKPAENPAPGDTAKRSRGTILVVDDDEFVVELAKEFLERAGHRVLTAAGGRAGIACFQERGREIDVVLLDLAMPDASGEEVLQELRRVRPGVPVIVSTGYAAEVAAKRVLEHGVAGFVRKPYEPEDLVDQIGLALAGARTRAA